MEPSEGRGAVDSKEPEEGRKRASELGEVGSGWCCTELAHMASSDSPPT